MAKSRWTRVFPKATSIGPGSSKNGKVAVFSSSDRDPGQYLLYAYLTLPAGKPAKNLPLVAVIHGGPFGIHDAWGFEPDIQFLASRGYAVVQPNYRGSGGYGLRHYTSGFKQWDLAMQDDVTDGVRYRSRRASSIRRASASTAEATAAMQP